MEPIERIFTVQIIAWNPARRKSPKGGTPEEGMTLT